MPLYGVVWKCVLFIVCISTGTKAFAPVISAPICLGGIQGKRFVLAPRGPPNLGHTLQIPLAPLQSLRIWSPHGATAFDEIPRYITKSDKTIALDGTGFCVEAADDSSIRINWCSGRPIQQWDFVPRDHGRTNKIQLHGTKKCIDIDVTQSGLNGAAVNLRDCDEEASKAWGFEGSIPPPRPGSDSPSPLLQHVLGDVRHTAISFLAMGAFGALCLYAWLWRRPTKASMRIVHQGGTPLDVEMGGVALAFPLPMQASRSWVFPLPDQKCRSTLMSMKFTADGESHGDTKASVIDGKAIAASIRQEIKQGSDDLFASHGIRPGLGVILVGQRKDSESYVRNKKKAAAGVNFHTVDVHLDEAVAQDELLKEVEKLNADPKIHGILVQLPLPSHIAENIILKAIRIEKDADGFSSFNIGNLCLKGGDPPLAIPCTPAGCVELLQRSNVSIEGKRAVVIGRSNIVGMPVGSLLMACDATVTICHSRTQNMQEIVREADIVVAAIGKPEFIKGSWLKPGCVVIDVGINAVEDASKKAGYRLVGDVAFDEALLVASQITPVPGGVGPMTIAMLLKNTLNLARHSVDLPPLP